MLLELNAIKKEFEHPSGGENTVVLTNIFLQMEAGESVAVVGPSGSGKSTLLNIIGALDRPTEGSVVLEGKDLGSLSDRELSRIRNQKLGFIFQLHHLLPQCTVFENVLIPTIPLGPKISKAEYQERAAVLLEKVGLKNHLSHFPAQLSGGELQRVAVVRALINNPILILADEPTGSLDRDSAQNLGDLLVHLNQEENTALIVVTHSIELAGKMGKIYQLKNGRLEILPNP